MRITIIGATGGIGTQLAQAQAAGHDVTAVARSPEKLASDVRGVGVDLSVPSPPGLAAAVPTPTRSSRRSEPGPPPTPGSPRGGRRRSSRR
jgi:nucleoside-diphosphate-sugar epimerase